MTDRPPTAPSHAATPAGLRLTVNGEPRLAAPGTTIADLVAAARLTPDKVAVELNKRLVRAADYGRTLADGDAVEIVTFVGGG